jgi:hypothetical protein
MIIITFDDAVNDENWDLYQDKLFPPTLKVKALNGIKRQTIRPETVMIFFLKGLGQDGRPVKFKKYFLNNFRITGVFRNCLRLLSCRPQQAL